MILDYNKSTNKLLIKCDDKNTFDQLREEFSIADKNARFKRFGYYTKNRKYAITPTGQCQLGLYYEIRRALVRNQVTNVSITQSLEDVLKRRISYDVDEGLLKTTLRDYQRDVLEQALNSGWGTCVLGTGAGKTLVTASLVEHFFKHSTQSKTFKCVIVVPDLGLVNQTYQEFIDNNVTFTVSKWTGTNKLDITSNAIIVNTQLLISRFAENDWLKYIDLLIVDECHKATSSNQLSKLITTIKTKHRYGFTGTLPEDNYEKWSIIGKLGPLLYEKTSHSLRQENYLSDVEVRIIDLQHSYIPKIENHNDPYRDELEFLYTSEQRNSFLSKLCNKLSNNALILVNHIKHGEALYQEISKNKQSNKEVYFIRGEVDVEERDKIKALIESNTNVICIAISAIFSTGINIKNLHFIIFAAGGKSFIRTVQSIGRGLRLHHSKTKLVIFDICDNLRYSQQHSQKREEIYKKEKIKTQRNTFLLT
jgi:superfamily II DNA or RNA helicase